MSFAAPTVNRVGSGPNSQREERRVDVALRDVANYDFLRELGKGTFGKVYLARNRRAPEVGLLAVKRIELSNMIDEKSKADCIGERDLLSALRSDNVIKCYVSFAQNGHLYIVLQYADQGDLDKLISMARKRRRVMSERLVWDLFLQMCNGAHALHQKRILHRDLKPANVLLARQGGGLVVKLGDLGFGRKFSDRTAQAMTVLGSPWYMAPERYDNVRGYDFKSDVWALGCILYEAKTTQLGSMARYCMHPDPNCRPDTDTLLHHANRNLDKAGGHGARMNR